MANHHRPDQRARALAALQLRINGHTWQEIADRTDWKTEAGVRRAVGALLDKWESESVDEYRTVQDQRYLALLRAWWPAATGTHDDDPDDKAAGIVLRVMEAINKLHGLNRETPGGNDQRMSPDEFRAALAEYVALQSAAPSAALEPAAQR
ncbi:hypothetical protein IU421_13175 [Nocardia cyriacigeorgica]|uniref:hypothetical protein n=1 Tax=Nocardia cyriacigeorgica TaxID=135487 RepID=UPI00189360C1|nr:hypothetical protein [Nocardia cyriacigeorgica]MBF6515232.1 hypothetical protein [Nocardia cyriacigeorgica]